MPRVSSRVVLAEHRTGLLRRRVAAGIRQRAAPVALTILLELLLLCALLGLGIGFAQKDRRSSEIVTTFVVPKDSPPAPEPPQSQPSATAPEPAAVAAAPPPPSSPPSSPPVALPLAPIAMPSAVAAPATQAPLSEVPLANAPVTHSDGAGARGTAGPGRSGDSELVSGNGIDGDALYTAEWYRKPTPEDFRPYMRRVRKPGWAVIDCRTRPQYRVDRCVLVEEGPAGSNTGRALLEASWHFKVRPPRVGGRSQVGERVRIRIDFRPMGG